MKNYSKPQPAKLLSSLLAFSYMSLVFVPAYASDTEVYTRQNANIERSPTLMMMFDTSGSMAQCVQNEGSPNASYPSSGGCVLADGRMTTLKRSMDKILNGGGGVTPAPGFLRMGLSRYAQNGAGGWVIYPARPLDAAVEINPSGSVNNTGATSPVSAKTDAEEATGTITGTVDLTVGAKSGQNQAVGLYFGDVRLPKGAIVSSATLQLTAKQSDILLSTWQVSVQDTGNAPDFTSTSIASRSYYNDPSISNFVPPAWTANTSVTINVGGLVQYIANRSDWCGGNGMMFRLRDIGTLPATRVAYSYKGANNISKPEYAPKLTINYTIDPSLSSSCMKNVTSTRVYGIKLPADDAIWTSTSGSTNGTTLQYNRVNSSPALRNNAGFRFNGLEIPQGATINSATLRATSATTIASGIRPTEVHVFDSNNLNAFCAATTCTTTEVNALNALPVVTSPSSAVTTFTPSGLVSGSTVVGATNNNDVLTINVTDAVQSIVNKPTWAVGNALGFRMRNTSTSTSNSSNATFYARDNSASSKSMLLTVTWTVPELNDLRVLQTVREQLHEAIQALDIPSATPLAGSYAETARYMFGMTSHTSAQTPDVRTLNDAGTSYKTPVNAQNQCAGNYIFLLTDGQPNGLGGADSSVPQITGDASCSATNATFDAANIAGTSSKTDWRCMMYLARYAKLTNNRVNSPIRTNTVIFGPEGTNGVTGANMAKVASLGDGKYYQATDENKLITAILETISSAIDFSGSISAPGVAVNQYNRLNSLNQLYYLLFEPVPQRVRWDGNLKRYKLSFDTGEVQDANSEDAIDSDGMFKKTSQSFWSAADDGGSVLSGGAAEQLPNPESRNMYTYTGSLPTTYTLPLQKIDLTNAEFNASAKSIMNISDDNLYKNLMNWYKGYAITDLENGLVSVSASTALRRELGAGLHSQPILVNYGFSGSNPSDTSQQKNIIFFSTTEGTLHAINANTGVEQFAFIPGEKLATLKQQFDNPSGVALPEFGMDLTWTVWRQDVNGDGQIGSGDKVYLYGGMRMGGNNYYALDLTDITKPKLLFSIKGGVGAYANLGQTWSQPVVGNVKINNQVKTVLVFAGGYDERHETENTLFTGADKGNQIYIIDAQTGQLYWSASGNTTDSPTKYVTEMQYSMPSEPKLIDFNSDGLVDNIYIGDLGGQVFRLDINNKTTTNTGLVKRVKVLAKLGQTAASGLGATDQRRFYNAATVALYRDNATPPAPFLAVGIGSGYQSHPLNVTTQDRFHVIFDYDAPRADLLTLAENSASLQATATPNDLALLSSDLTATAGANVTGKKGWYMNLPDAGEKNLSSALIFALQTADQKTESRIVFNTYVPSNQNNSCSAVTGRTKLYIMCMPYGKLCSDQTTRVRDNLLLGLSGDSQLLIGKDASNQSRVVILTGNQGTGKNLNDSPSVTNNPHSRKIRWQEVQRNPQVNP
ncbi:PilC/PilY family type IV pilus protein [Agitococcus lubricus]|uniref:Type IV pilus assembly protein PilY1 n=1 Tax=Agitococcus lubricus TaxID=1077255 RepID=A0A2T5J2G1_9GAMM|nr:PilC/PilY family type IV pilus protein [Agitococcus lubricus]PTQ90677.1 type IV pilus assembly protein PilY1 [Agitococcus lubricus]